MKERPILFSGPMVKAILDGRKTQTRRVAKEFNHQHASIVKCFPHQKGCPYGEPGDRLWVRETHRPVCSGEIIGGNSVLRYGVAYQADGAVSWNTHVTLMSGFQDSARPMQFDPLRWKPSIHMRRSHSRITLEIANVRVERVQEISEDDAQAEGAERQWRPEEDDRWMASAEEIAAGYEPPKNYVSGFVNLWDSINAKRGFGWDVNPLVWVIEFKKLETPRRVA